MRTFRHGSPVPIADIEASFDHSISESYQRGRNSEAQRLCCPDVNHQLIFRWQLNWKIARLLALENTRCINTSAAVSVGLTRSVTYQAASIYKSTQIITRWDGVKRGKPNQLATPATKERPAADEERTGTGFRDHRKGRVDLLFAPRFEHNEFPSDGACCCLYFTGLLVKHRKVRVLQNSDKFGLGNQLM